MSNVFNVCKIINGKISKYSKYRLLKFFIAYFYEQFASIVGKPESKK